MTADDELEALAVWNDAGAALWSDADTPAQAEFHRKAAAFLRSLKEGDSTTSSQARAERDSGLDNSPPASGLTGPERATCAAGHRVPIAEPCPHCGATENEECGLISAGESAGVAAPSADPDSLPSPVGTALRLPTVEEALLSERFPLVTKQIDGTISEEEMDRLTRIRAALDCFDKTVLTFAPPPSAELGLETTEEERRQWLALAGCPSELEQWCIKACHDIDRLSAEVARQKELVCSADIVRDIAARAQEREACAKIADDRALSWKAEQKHDLTCSACNDANKREYESKEIAAAIRARTP